MPSWRSGCRRVKERVRDSVNMGIVWVGGVRAISMRVDRLVGVICAACDWMDISAGWDVETPTHVYL